MENTDAKVFLMIEDLSRDALMELLEYEEDWASKRHLIDCMRKSYEQGTILAEDIIAAWNDDTWNGKE